MNCKGRPYTILYILESITEHKKTSQFTKTENREYFVVKIFSDSLAYANIKCVKYVNNNAVQGHLSLKII